MKSYLPANFNERSAKSIFADLASVREFCQSVVDLATAEPQDTSTASGRSDIRSQAAAIGRARAALSRRADELIQPLEDQKAAIRARLTDGTAMLKAAQVSLKQPLIDWELQERARVDRLQARLRDLERPYLRGTADELRQRLGEHEALGPFTPADWAEYAQQAEAAHERGAISLHDALQRQIVIEAQQKRISELDPPSSQPTPAPAPKAAAEAAPNAPSPLPPRNDVFETIADKIVETVGLKRPDAQRLITAVLDNKIPCMRIEL